MIKTKAPKDQACIQRAGLHPTSKLSHTEQCDPEKKHPTTKLASNEIQWPGFHPTGTQSNNDQVIKRHVPNDQAGLQNEHDATTTNCDQKRNHPMSRLWSNKNPRPQQLTWLREKSSNDQAFTQQGHKTTTTKWLREDVSNEQAGIQQEHKATTTNVIKKKYIQWAGRHLTRT